MTRLSTTERYPPNSLPATNSFTSAHPTILTRNPLQQRNNHFYHERFQFKSKHSHTPIFHQQKTDLSWLIASRSVEYHQKSKKQSSTELRTTRIRSLLPFGYFPLSHPAFHTFSSLRLLVGPPWFLYFAECK